MSTNPLKLILNIEKYQSIAISKSKENSVNRMNSIGEGFELYIKNLFCGYLDNVQEDKINYEDFFSYLGNNTNPPDLIIRNSDAVEIKKIEGLNSDLALNSSNPKNKLSSKSTLITASCKNCEEAQWIEKDILYIIGSIKNHTLTKMWLVYGDCYCATNETYEKVKIYIQDSVNKIPDLEVGETKELGRFNRIDPLGITNLRVRGMWTIQHPSKVFKYLETASEFDINCLILEGKYSAFPIEDRNKIELNKNIKISDVKIKDPNNPAKLLKAKLIQLCLN